ncbi:VOC family protein [Leisingera methylohalidivorans]|uniref:Glyoxalase n=1 Tax=Leisingera methylohalidivorans DSM 14336 TaxID=999552 RepID=V9VWA4_9RHOB|nr:VOC family protein [Leisingera methylohalidivorans]AHD02233.1 glyoxalase [Leisingera methylohalidivorans DSM 14336]
MDPLVHRLGFVALNVKNLDAAIADARDVMGLSLVGQGNGRALLTSNDRHAELIFYQAEASELHTIGLEALTPAHVGEVARRARAEGLEVVSETPSLPAMEHGVTIRFSENHLVEVHTPMLRDRPSRYSGPGIHPRYIDHANLTARDPASASEEMMRVLGLKLSERTAGWELSWMRAGDGRHHTLAFVKSDAAGIHHYSWEFADFNDFKRLGDVLDTFDRKLVWGPGRHGAGDNLFVYYVDAAGFLVECTAEMERIADPEFQARVVDPGENLSNYKVVNRWGQLPSQEWIGHFIPCMGRPGH